MEKLEPTYETSTQGEKTLSELCKKALIQLEKESYEVTKTYSPPITSDTLAATYINLSIGELGEVNRENFVTLYLNAQNKVLERKVITGQGANCIIYFRDVIEPIVNNPLIDRIICGHNHPTGVVEASGADKSFTKDLAHLCEILKTPLLDHIIVDTSNTANFLSMKDKGLL